MDDPFRVVLVSPRNPLNIGAAARAMSNFGVRRLRLVNPYDRAFQEARSAVRSRYILDAAEVTDNLAEAIADCQLVVGTTAGGPRDLHLPLHRLDAAASHIAVSAKPVALLFGSEKFGLSNHDLSFCHWLIRIPTREDHGSMNLGQAVAIVLYELHRSADAVVDFPPPAWADAGDYDRITNLLVDLLGQAGYTQEMTSESSELKVRRLVRRLGLPASDAKTWQGMLRQILWKVKRSSQPEDPA